MHCVAHGGGKRCEKQGCSKQVAKGSLFCADCQIVLLYAPGDGG